MSAIICPWCGTNYLAFQSNCKNCGGPLPAPAAMAARPTGQIIQPPPPPRPIAENYAWKLLMSDGGGFGGLIMTLLGGIFTVVGAALTLGVVTAFVGIPFLIFGVPALYFGLKFLRPAWNRAKQTVRVLREGQAATGRILTVKEDRSVTYNGAPAQKIRYQFEVNGRAYTGEVSTFNDLPAEIAPQQPAAVLYLEGAPEFNSLYPHP